jgi:hypothetical protein
MKLSNLPPNQRVFTTTQITQGKAPIYYVTSDAEGDLYATGTDKLSNDNAQIISLDQLLKIAPDLKEIIVESGNRLFRASVGSDWQPF